MSARYFVDTDGHQLEVWRQEDDGLPVVVKDPVEAFRAGMEAAREVAS